MFGDPRDWKSRICFFAVVEAGKDAGYVGIILAGLGFTGVLLWAVMSEFFSSNSPQKLFAKALRAVKHHEEVTRELPHVPVVPIV